jgi:hypothetical protein
MVEVGSAATDYHPNSTEVFEAVGTATGNPNVLAVDWSVSGIESAMCPVDLTLSPTAAVFGQLWKDSYLYWGNKTISPVPVILEAESMTRTGFSVVADATARGGNVARRIPTAGGQGSLLFDFETALQYPRDEGYAVLILANKTSVSVDFKVWVTLLTRGGTLQTTPAVITTTDVMPNYYYLGTLPSNNIIRTLTVTFESGIDATFGIEVDCVVILPLNEYDQILQLPDADVTALTAGNFKLVGGALARMAPRLDVLGTGSERIDLGWRGDAWLVHAEGYAANVLPMWLRDNEWMYGGGVNLTVTARRMLAFLTPE